MASPPKALKVIGLGSVLVIVLAALAILWMAAWPQSPGRSPGLIEQLPGTKAKDKAPDDPLVIVTWNVAWGYGWGSEGSGKAQGAEHFEKSLAAMGEVLLKLDPDVVLLQEVDFDSTRSHHVDQAKALARAARLPYFAKAESWTARWVPFPYWPISEHFGTMHSGGAILSRYPLRDASVELLQKPSENPAWYNLFYLFRYLQSVTVEIPGKALRVHNTHLEAFKEANRVEQAKRVIAILSEAPSGLVIFGGDLNAPPPEQRSKSGYADEPGTNHENDPTIELFREAPGLVELVSSSSLSADASAFFTFPSHSPNRMLDHLFGGAGIEVLDVRVAKEAGTTSDHLPIVAKIRLRD